MSRERLLAFEPQAIWGSLYSVYGDRVDYPWPVNYLGFDFIVGLHKLPSGKFACVAPLTYGRARINVGPDHISIDDGW